MFNQAAAKKAAKQRMEGLGAAALGRGHRRLQFGQEKYLGPGARNIWDRVRELFGTQLEKYLGPGKKNQGPGERKFGTQR